MLNIIYFSSVPWYYLKQRSHELTEAFSKLGNVNNVFYFSYFEYFGSSQFSFNRLKRFFLNDYINVKKNFIVVNPKILFPEKVFKNFFKRLNLQRRQREIIKVLRRYTSLKNYKNLVIVSHPLILEYIHEDLIKKKIYI
ncbi:hypothetical protein ciss_21470 [Carboxydothermus islandicus]|uniref:Uncharacterized protein n=1 Tax=Carboxydothermus islandicus TaxID=661089 RepID=A0A1L8D517_9THEO|nr:hypothetical protein ciss_21470 [Carboxydothermus islandicus]